MYLLLDGISNISVGILDKLYLSTTNERYIKENILITCIVNNNNINNNIFTSRYNWSRNMKIHVTFLHHMFKKPIFYIRCSI